MKNFSLLSRAVATAAAIAGACVLVYASPAVAFTPTLKQGGENTPLNLGSSSSAAGAHPATSGGGGASIVRTIVGLAIVIAVIWGLAWILKQVKAGRDPNLSSDGLASVAALTLGSGRSVHLVRAGSDYVLIGSTEHGVAPIHRYSEQEAREVGLALADAPDAPSIAGERPRLLGAAGQLVAGAGRALTQSSAAREARLPASHSPVAGRRPDPMRASTASIGLIDRLREMTVRR
jgi:flagellar protein FliO/FliZ